MDFRGITCLVTGGSKGIGKATVELLASKGARVFTCALEGHGLEDVLRAMKEKDFDVQGHECDVFKAEDLENLMNKVSEAFDGKLNVLVNNVGLYLVKPFLEHTREDVDTITGGNAKLLVDTCQRAYPLLKASGNASVVNIGSIAACPRATKSGISYSMSKAALDVLTRNLACDWGQYNIRVNAVSPGLIDTPLAAQVMSNERALQGYKFETPMKRVGNAAEVAGAVVFFASSASAYVTGQTLYVDGGYSVRGMGY